MCVTPINEPPLCYPPFYSLPLFCPLQLLTKDLDVLRHDHSLPSFSFCIHAPSSTLKHPRSCTHYAKNTPLTGTTLTSHTCLHKTPLAQFNPFTPAVPWWSNQYANKSPSNALICMKELQWVLLQHIHKSMFPETCFNLDASKANICWLIIRLTLGDIRVVILEVIQTVVGCCNAVTMNAAVLSTRPFW